MRDVEFPKHCKKFLERCKKYHSDEEDTRLYIKVMKERRDRWNSKDLADKVGVREFLFDCYLFKWGKMARVFPKAIRENLYQKFLECMPSILKRYEELGTVNLISSEFEKYEDKIKSIYEEICELQVPYKGGRRRIGPTATSKLLHFFFPELFVMWDLKNVRKKQKYGESAEEYLRYLKDKRHALKEIVRNYVNRYGGSETQAIEKLVEIHANELSEMGFKRFQEPVTKLLDEINFSDNNSNAHKSVDKTYTSCYN